MKKVDLKKMREVNAGMMCIAEDGLCLDFFLAGEEMCALYVAYMPLTAVEADVPGFTK